MHCSYIQEQHQQLMFQMIQQQQQRQDKQHHLANHHLPHTITSLNAAAAAAHSVNSGSSHPRAAHSATYHQKAVHAVSSDATNTQRTAHLVNNLTQQRAMHTLPTVAPQSGPSKTGSKSRGEKQLRDKSWYPHWFNTNCYVMYTQFCFGVEQKPLLKLQSENLQQEHSGNFIGFPLQVIVIVISDLPLHVSFVIRVYLDFCAEELNFEAYSPCWSSVRYQLM